MEPHNSGQDTEARIGVDGPASISTVQQLIKLRRFPEAASAASGLVGLQPDNADALLLLGVAQAELRMFAEAELSIRRAISARSSAPWTWSLLLANVLRDAGEPRKAGIEAEALLAREPQRAQIHNALGLALQDQELHADALSSFRTAYALDPQYAPAYLNAANTLQQTGQLADAISEIQSGMDMLPSRQDLALALAKLFDRMGRRAEAKAQYERAISLAPSGSADAYNRLGRLLYADADIYSAIVAFEHALKIDSADVEVWNALGNCYLDVGGLDHASRCFSAALQIRPDYAEIYDNLLLSYHYNPKLGAEAMYAAHREWATRFAAAALPAVPLSWPGSEVRKVRVGLLSDGFSRGPVSYFLLPLLRNIDTTQFEVHCYSAGSIKDDAQEQMRLLVAHWQDVAAIDNEQLALRIRADRIDILVDLDGHGPGNRLRAVSYKPAPVVISWLDYFNTTGLDVVDVVVSDEVSTPATGTQLFSETVLRLDPSRLCYSPPTYAPAPAVLPMARNGYVTFGSFNRLSKLAEPVVTLWAKLLREIPNSRLILKSAAFAHPYTRTVFLQRFHVRGIAVERIELRGASPHEQMLAEYGDIDVALDTFPYNGGLTTCEALWMGVPVVALLGSSMISRQSAALVSAAGFPQWVAASDQQWLELVRTLVASPDELATQRRELRGRVASSPLTDGATFARKFEGLLRDAMSMVRDA
jgi:predicted O-linked N-acetylglucosamine transferase (SPINDLY family)